MHARTHANAHTSCRVETSIGAKSPILVRKNWENYNQMLDSTLQKNQNSKFYHPLFGSKSLAILTKTPTLPPFWHTHTKFKINPRLDRLARLVKTFPGFFSREGLQNSEEDARYRLEKYDT